MLIGSGLCFWCVGTSEGAMLGCFTADVGPPQPDESPLPAILVVGPRDATLGFSFPRRASSSPRDMSLSVSDWVAGRDGVNPGFR